MKYTKTPDNDSFFAAVLFMLMLLTAALLFIAVMKYLPKPDTPENEKVQEFSSGTGNGSGNGQGDGSENGGGSEEQGTGTGENGKDTGQDNSDDSGKGKDDGKEKDAGEGKGDGKKGSDGGKEKSGGGQDGSSPEKDDGKGGSDNNDGTQGSGDQQKNGSGGSGQKDNNRGKGKNSEEIYIDPGKNNKDDNRKKNGNEKKDPSSSGKGTFSTGGKNVFDVKRHENVLFVVDISPSMGNPAKEGVPKLEILKIHLKAVLQIQQNNRSRGKYMILAFSSGVICFPDENKQFSFNSASDLEKASAWIDQINKLPRMATPLYAAMNKVGDVMKKPGIKVDAVYLLTDGEPNDVRETKFYIELMRKKYPKKVVVHTIAIGHHSELLKTIAKHGNGKYTRYE